jgi:VanZ family protein
MTKIMVKYQNIKPFLKVGTENRPKFIQYFFDWTDFYKTANIWLSYYIMGLSMLLSSTCRHGGFYAITFVLTFKKGLIF